MKEFGKILKTYIIESEQSQKAFSRLVDLTPAALSQIINGKTRPRQATLTRIMQVLNLSREKEQRLIKAYESQNSLPIDNTAPSDPIKLYQENRERVYQYMHIKSRAIAFNNEIEECLKLSGKSYIKNYTKNELSCDFYLPEKNMAIVCKFNAARDVEKTLTEMAITKEHFALDDVLLVVPMMTELSDENKALFKKLNLSLCSTSTILTHLK